MKWLLTNRAWRDYQGAPAAVQKAFDKQVRFLAEDLRHPSLRAKKYDEANDIWQARVTRDWRFYFQTQGDTYTPRNSEFLELLEVCLCRKRIASLCSVRSLYCHRSIVSCALTRDSPRRGTTFQTTSPD